MSVFYRKYQNKNRHSVAYGKWFARAVTIGKTINIDELAKHMSEHNTPYSKGAIKGVLTDMIGCIRELMLEGLLGRHPDEEGRCSLERGLLHHEAHQERLYARPCHWRVHPSGTDQGRQRERAAQELHRLQGG